MIASMLTFAAGVVVGMQALLVGYLLVLTALAVVMALRSRTARPVPHDHRRRFAVLVPAHNEEAVLARLLESLDALAYPRHLYDVCVVADNCDDATAAIGRVFGARVYERFDDTERAKGFALRWLLERLGEDGLAYDAYVIVDADSVLAPNFLQAMDARLERGASAVQAYYSVLNPSDSAVAGLRSAALAAVHYLRPLGRSALGLSAGLKGNGMCFAAPVVERFGWRWFTLAEDVEFHLALVGAGIRVEFAPETWVKGEMPVTLAQAHSQNARWERGRLQMARRTAPRLVLGGLRGRKWLQVDAAAEQLIPPLSVPFAVSAASVPAGILLDAPGVWLAAVLCLVGYAAYLLTALALVGAPARIYLTLAAAPLYIAWKVGLYVRSLLTPRTTDWVRTGRTSADATPS